MKASPDKFISRYLKRRQNQLQKEYNLNKSFSNQFYSEKCFLAQKRLDRLTKALNRNEMVKATCIDEENVWVITEVTDPSENSNTFLRYRLVDLKAQWRIEFVEAMCEKCSGNQISSNCVICQRNGWFSLFPSEEKKKRFPAFCWRRREPRIPEILSGRIKD